jgi:WD40 repeat protein
MPNRDPRPVIFLAFANDRDDHARYLRNLPEEQRRVRQRLEQDEATRICELVIHPNITADELLDVFQHPRYRDRIAIFHFGGHAGGYQLLLESTAGRPELAHGEGLAGFLALQRSLQLVFLNGCSTQPQVEGLLDSGVPAVIATSESIADAMAMELSARFYSALAGGTTVGEAYAQAVAAVRTVKGGRTREVSRDSAGATDRWPWELYLKPGAENVRDWSLPKAAGDPLFGLPPLPEQDLPDTPYRHLQWFRAEDAELFFGRGREIREFYDLVTSASTSPILLFYGATGVGKSSLLAAGVLPRLATCCEVQYRRRERDLGITQTLAAALGIHAGSDAAIGATWQAIEAHEGRPLTIILDQVEEVYTRPQPEETDELERLMGVLSQAFAKRSSRPRGKLVLAFREEWLASIESRLRNAELPRTKCRIEPLARDAIVEIVEGPERSERLQTQFRLTIEPGLAELIAHDLLKDQNAALAPTLEILLSKMWKQANVVNAAAPAFRIDMYRQLSSKGLLLDDFVEEQLNALRSWNAKAADTGLALDLLASHTTPGGTAESQKRTELEGAYLHQSALLPGLLQECKDLYLLADYELAAEGGGRLAGSRLGHDTLAPLIRQRFAESDRPGQRVRRILEHHAREWTEGRTGAPLDETDLATVEQGASGMRVRTAAEQRLVDLSRRMHRIVAGVQHPDPLVRALVVTGLDRYPALRGRERLASLAAQEAIPEAVLYGHQDVVTGATFSPDGNFVVTASWDNTARVWPMDGSGDPLVLRGHESWIHSAVFSRDGRWVVTASSDRTARVWQADGSGKPVVLDGHEDVVYFGVFSPDGARVLTVSNDGTARVWPADGSGNPVVLRQEKHVRSAAFSPDGNSVITGSEDGVAWIWRADGSGEPVVLDGHKDVIYSVVFSPDGSRVLTASGDWTARVRSADGFGQRVVLSGHKGSVSSAAFSPDGSRVVTSSEDRTAVVWAADGYGEPVVLRGHEERVLSAVFSPDGSQVVTASRDGTARVWPADGSGDPLVLRGHVGEVGSAVFSPDGSRILTASDDGTTRVWRANGSDEPVVLRHEDGVRSATFSPDGSRVLTVSPYRTAYGTAWVWHADGSGKPVALRQEKHLRSATFSPNGSRVVTASVDGTASVWQADGSCEPVVLHGHESEVIGALLSPDNSRILTASWDRTARVWAADGASEPVVLRGHEEALHSAEFSPDGTLIVTASEDMTARVWAADGSGEPVVLRGHDHRVQSARFSADGTQVVTASDDRTARVWAADGSGEPVVLRGHDHRVQSARFSADSTRVVTASDDRTARVWAADGRGEPVVLRGHEKVVNSAEFSPDGTRIVTASEDRTARVWLADGSGEPMVLRHKAEVNSAAFSADGSRVVTASGDGTARVWRVSWEALLRHLRRATTACLTPTQRRELLGESEEEARAAYEACERSFGRTPILDRA